MKKILILFLSVLLCSCAFKQDFYSLGIDDYTVTVGYDDADFLSLAFDFKIKDTLEPNESVEDVELYLFNRLLGVCTLSNPQNKTIASKDAVITKLTVYLEDQKGRTFALNGEVLDSSIKATCEKYNGEYIERNGYACVIQSNTPDKRLNVVELYGDYLNIDQDKLDHITIYFE